MKKRLISVLFCLLSLTAGAHEDHAHTAKTTLAISLAFDDAGNLWRTSVKDGVVQVAKSQDLGKSFAPPVNVSLAPQKISADGEARPKIAISPQGNIYLTWTQTLKAPFAGYIWFARSVDGGKSFEKPYIVHNDRAETTHRFDALSLSPNGNIMVLWVDKRDSIAAKMAGKIYDGAAIYYAVSSDNGKSFAVEQKLADSSCECCRIASTHKPDGTVVAMWRYVFAGSERDHMIAEVPSHANQIVDLHRATFGHWQIDGCPHHGAAIASGGEGDNWWGYHMAYYDGNPAKPGLYYSRMDGVAWASSPPKKFGNSAQQAGHPALLSLGENVWLVWREITGKASQIIGAVSYDGGKSWGEARELASSTEGADYPQLLSYHGRAYLAWNTADKGLQLLAL